MVLLRAEIPEDAFTAPLLGTERAGNGVVIREDGLVLTIGYLITEASTIWLTTNKGTVVGGYPLAYDQATGFGLVQPLGKLGVDADRARQRVLGPRRARTSWSPATAARAHALKATVFAKREFAGYWEYVLDEALFTAPAHPQWGGAALIGADGKLARHRLAAGAGEDRRRHDPGQHDRADRPARADPRRHAETGRANRPPRPWLGMYATEAGERLVVAGLAPGGPGGARRRAAWATR